MPEPCQPGTTDAPPDLDRRPTRAAAPCPGPRGLGRGAGGAAPAEPIARAVDAAGHGRADAVAPPSSPRPTRRRRRRPTRRHAAGSPDAHAGPDPDARPDPDPGSCADRRRSASGPSPSTPATNKATVRVTTTPTGFVAPWRYVDRRPRERRRERRDAAPTRSRSRSSTTARSRPRASASRSPTPPAARRRRVDPRSIALPAAPGRAARRRPHPRRADPDRGLVRRPPAGRRIAGARGGAGHLPHARGGGRQPGVRAGDVPRREPLRDAGLRRHHPQLGEHPLLLLAGRLRRRAVLARQRVHVRAVPDAGSRASGRTPRCSSGTTTAATRP